MSNKKSSKLPIKFIVLILLLASMILIIFSLVSSDKISVPERSLNTEPALEQLKPTKKSSLEIFSSQEFLDLYNGLSYPNTQQISEGSSITGDAIADKRIRKLAIDRGYRIRSAPVADVFVDISPGQILQQRASIDWRKLTKAAEKQDLILSTTAAYRTAEDQKNIFLRRLGSISYESIGKGLADTKVVEILKTTAPPGYSRHHSGYTVDINCQSQPQVRFKDSACFKWLSDNNYKNAKTYGWIPSYPKDVTNQGPEPESWEYVWVGVETLLK